jgi:GT2 family glycosyltransferase
MGRSGSHVPSASIIIPNWNGREHLARCLPALSTQTYQDIQVIVVDNGSDDESVMWLRENYPSVEIVALEHNLGFAAACNAGIQTAAAELVITLNNDTVPYPDFVAALLRATDRFPGVGMFAAILWLEGEPPLIDAAGVEVDRLGVAWNIARGSPAAELPSIPGSPFGPCAGAALYRRRLLQDVGQFDEGYFAYLEDVELAWRARWAGWECISVSDAVVRHVHSATGGQNLPRKFWLLGRNRLWTILRHYPRPHLWHRLPLLLCNEMLTGLMATFALRHPAPLQGRLAALRQWQVATRPSCPAPRRLSPAEVFALLSPAPSLAGRWARYRTLEDDPGS